MAKLSDILSHLERDYPLRHAAEWDNVGLLLGDDSADVRSVLTCLTLTTNIVNEAVRVGADLVLTHHPILFKAAKKLSTRTSEGRIVWPLAKAGIAVYSSHTAYDDAAFGINQQLADLFGLVEVRPLRPILREKEYKVVVFTPENDLANVSDAMFAAGAGIIGNYRECSFRLRGTGTFFPVAGANPVVGQVGRREETTEWRLEVVCSRAKLSGVLAAMKAAHSYEEVAFDVYPLEPIADKVGHGRIGQLSQALDLHRFAAMVRECLRCGPIQIVGEPTKSVATVAIACGAAGEYLGDAIAAKADLFLTGEMRFHDYLAAQSQGVGLLLPGHYATERHAMETLAEKLKKAWPELTVQASQAECDPVSWV